tara:strand:- start:432 stop:638 length:207 start_codon:yes stop_codon:yes gene_type:complete
MLRVKLVLYKQRRNKVYELNQRVIATIDGDEKIVSVVGRTFESEPRYDVRLSDGSIVASITTIRELDT